MVTCVCVSLNPPVFYTILTHRRTEFVEYSAPLNVYKAMESNCYSQETFELKLFAIRVRELSDELILIDSWVFNLQGQRNW